MPYCNIIIFDIGWLSFGQSSWITSKNKLETVLIDLDSKRISGVKINALKYSLLLICLFFWLLSCSLDKAFWFVPAFLVLDTRQLVQGHPHHHIKNMSLCLKNDHQKLLDKKIQKQLNTSWKEYKSIIKLLLLGTVFFETYIYALRCWGFWKEYNL